MALHHLNHLSGLSRKGSASTHSSLSELATWSCLATRGAEKPEEQMVSVHHYLYRRKDP